jgi:hypothetical protein
MGKGMRREDEKPYELTLSNSSVISLEGASVRRLTTSINRLETMKAGKSS